MRMAVRYYRELLCRCSPCRDRRKGLLNILVVHSCKDLRQDIIHTKDCLDATTFRSYFNKTRQQLQAQLTNLLKKNVPIVPVILGALLAPQLPELQFVQVVALPSQVADIHHLRVAELSKTECFAIVTAWNRNKKCTALNLPVLSLS